MTGRTSTKVTDRAGTPGLGALTCQDEDAAQEPEARVLQNEVSKAKGPIELFDTEPKPQDRPRRAAAPEEGAKTAIAQKARKGDAAPAMVPRNAPQIECRQRIEKTAGLSDMVPAHPRRAHAPARGSAFKAGGKKNGNGTARPS